MSAVIGGGKDVHFYRELSELLDDVRVSRSTITDGPGGAGSSRSGEDVRVLRPGDFRTVPERHAVVIAGTAPPIIVRLRRCLDGDDGRRLSEELAAARLAVDAARSRADDVAARTEAALGYSRANWMTAPDPQGSR